MILVVLSERKTSTTTYNTQPTTRSVGGETFLKETMITCISLILVFAFRFYFYIFVIIQPVKAYNYNLLYMNEIIFWNYIRAKSNFTNTMECKQKIIVYTEICGLQIADEVFELERCGLPCILNIFIVSFYTRRKQTE